MKTFHVSGVASEELASLAQKFDRSEIDLIRGGLALMKFALEAEKKGQKLLLTDENLKPLKEILLPS